MLTHNSNNHFPTIAIIGGGLGGSLCACFFAKHNFQVHVFEMRSDIRTQETEKGRSINMALSRRGRDSLAYINCDEMIAKTGVPLYARMMHDENGQTCILPYGPYGIDSDHMILSVQRDTLSKCLLNEASKSSNIKIHFEHKFINWNRDTKEASFYTSSGKQVNFNVDFIIGFDGSYSTVRTIMMKTEKINLTQEYLDLYYMEINIPSQNDHFSMPENYLHIWPRHKFIIIASPNQDKSFNATLILPISIFNNLLKSKEILEFFQEYFPDFLSFVGSDEILKIFYLTKPRSLITIKCSTYVSSYGDMLLMGDAAHSMAPFYAQGMNAAFEDCLVLFEILKQTNFHIQKAFIAYNRIRVPDAHAIADLSMYNYRELSHLVTQRSFVWRKKIDNFLYKLMPYWWIPLYNMVTFTRIPYHQCIQLRQRQDYILKIIRLIIYSVIGLYVLKNLFGLDIIKLYIIQLLSNKIYTTLCSIEFTISFAYLCICLVFFFQN